MKKKLEVTLGVIPPYSKNCPSLRVTHIVYIDKNKEDKFWKRAIGIYFGRVNDQFHFEETAQIELEYDEANSLSHLFGLTKYNHYDPASVFSWSDLAEIPDWLYYNEANGCWWHEKPPMDAAGIWIKYKDYLAKQDKGT